MEGTEAEDEESQEVIQQTGTITAIESATEVKTPSIYQYIQRPYLEPPLRIQYTFKTFEDILVPIGNILGGSLNSTIEKEVVFKEQDNQSQVLLYNGKEVVFN